MSNQAVANNSGQSNKRKKASLFTAGTYLDFPVLFLILFLVCFGLVMVYSTSFYKANATSGSGALYLKKQLLFAAIGVFLMFFLSLVRYTKLKNISTIFMFVTLALLIAVLVVGVSVNGSKRWLMIAGIQFQPSEVAKMALIIYMARVLSDNTKQLNSLLETLKMLAFPIVILLLVAYENLSTGIVCGLIVFGMWFVATPKMRHIVVLGSVFVAGVVAFVMMKGYRGARFEAWFDPENAENGYQIMQALYAIGSGGLFGRGLGQSIQKMGFIPEAYNDMIFSIICEELGIIGALALITVYVMLIMRFKFIAEAAPDRFGAFLMTGIIIHVAVQVLLNISVSTNVLPNTGCTLPFVSYGGTSLLILLCEMAIVLSVSRQIEPKRV